MKPSKIILQHLYDKGESDSKELSRRSGIPLRTVQRDLFKMKQGISLERKVGSGRPRLLNGQDTRRLLQLAVKDDMRTSTDLKLELEKRRSPNVSSRTITRYLNKAGYHYKTPKSEPLLTETHTVNRVQWCQDHIKTRWFNWIFSDESKFQLYRNGNGRWGQETQKLRQTKVWFINNGMGRNWKQRQNGITGNKR